MRNGSNFCARALIRGGQVNNRHKLLLPFFYLFKLQEFVDFWLVSCLLILGCTCEVVVIKVQSFGA
jgi:hypothetical protein